LALGPSASWARAQDARVTAGAGVSTYDLSGTGEALTTYVRADFPLRPALLVDVGVSAMFPKQQFGDTTTVLLPEAQVHLQLPRRLAPYVGAGLGFAADFREEAAGGTQVDITLSASGGVRFAVADALGLRAELRVRGHETGFVGTTADFTAGVGWRF
jgi:hypothetical protein